MSRKDRIAPFEVMRSKRKQQQTPVEQELLPEDFLDQGKDPEQVASKPFVPTSNGPLVLRIPRGYAVIGGFILIGLFTMSYWVGYAQGDKNRLVKMKQLETSRQEMYNRAAGVNASLPTSTLITPQTTTINNFTENHPNINTTSAGHQKYVPGFNYFVLVHYPSAEAKQLVEFLGQHGVDAAAILVNNNRFKVVALEGFLASELNTAKVQEYEQLLRRLGRLWKNSKRGAGDLSDMYQERYDGPPSN